MTAETDAKREADLARRLAETRAAAEAASAEADRQSLADQRAALLYSSYLEAQTALRAAEAEADRAWVRAVRRAGFKNFRIEEDRVLAAIARALGIDSEAVATAPNDEDPVGAALTEIERAIERCIAEADAEYRRLARSAARLKKKERALYQRVVSPSHGSGAPRARSHAAALWEKVRRLEEQTAARRALRSAVARLDKAGIERVAGAAARLLLAGRRGARRPAG